MNGDPQCCGGVGSGTPHRVFGLVVSQIRRRLWLRFDAMIFGNGFLPDHVLFLIPDAGSSSPEAARGAWSWIRVFGLESAQEEAFDLSRIGTRGLGHRSAAACLLLSAALVSHLFTCWHFHLSHEIACEPVNL